MGLAGVETLQTTYLNHTVELEPTLEDLDALTTYSQGSPVLQLSDRLCFLTVPVTVASDMIP
jgi:hypothetical protein